MIKIIPPSRSKRSFMIDDDIYTEVRHSAIDWDLTLSEYVEMALKLALEQPLPADKDKNQKTLEESIKSKRK